MLLLVIITWPMIFNIGTHDANSEWLYGPDGLASIGTAAAAAAAAAAETEAAASGETPCDDGCWFLCTGSANSCFGSPSIFFRLSDASKTDTQSYYYNDV